MIKDIQTYLEGMSHTMPDKCWWVSQIPDSIDTVIDFGCASGDLGIYLNHTYPHRFHYIGVDNSEQMLERVWQRGLKAYSSLGALKDIDTKRTVLVLNSVIHEVFSYSNGDELKEFFGQIKDLRPEYIAIRDMYLYFGQIKDPMSMVKAISNSPYAKQFKEYDNHYNFHFSWSTSLIEFLLKYRYQANWDREKQERYLWDWLPYFQGLLPDYSVRCDEIFNIPYLREQIKKDFGFDLQANTHRKILLKAK